MYQVTDDSLVPLGVLDGDLLYVRPLIDVQQAAGLLVVCNLRGEAFTKVLEFPVVVLEQERIHRISASGPDR